MESVTSMTWPLRVMQWMVNRHTVRCSVIVLLLGMGTGGVYATGGTAYAYPYLMLIPVLIAAAWYDLPGGLITALVAGIAMAVMPLNIDLGTEQSPFNYLLRLILYLSLGGVAGWLFQSRRQAFLAHRDIARTDQHSSLANQVALSEDLHKLLSPLRPTVRTVGVIKVKITDMADVIEALGPEAADELVVAISQRLSQAVRGEDQAYRTSPDELALIMLNVEPTDLYVICQRLLEIGEESLPIYQVLVRVQLAIGSAIAEDHHKTVVDLLREARLALLASIRQRQGYMHFSPTFDQRSLEAFKLIGRVREALAEKKFELHYQPKIRLSDGHVCGCEGLIRWWDDQGKLIPPGQFMPKVESTSLIGPLTHFVVQAAGAFALHPGNESAISINLSVHNLYDETLYERIQELIEHAGMRPERIEVELTESAFIGDLGDARDAVQRLRNLGIGVSIDDFGTGFSSFEYLQHLPITGLKIDRAFVTHLGDSEQARKLMACMIEIGHALDLVVTAEGVETQQQAEILQQLGCDQAQGFYYSPALPAEAYHAWCQRHAESRTSPPPNH
ncbi:GGDEF domain-containing phosphodiesterase [Cobetia sp. 1CM21F]|uniref:putative bifunctional diguanylate cyclase/phosphodiesterase n=1 Tax=Cobetia sp. 1CM21F TaxID=2929163 RepID=UPI0020C009FA|nr:GGDEF domain-containing phosphodiesterase [Cobetia sp. 1CM21F]MCK8069796.1 GGDEF domain-containing phosphodiesterase [Cobetia sp. 1CM21F]